MEIISNNKKKKLVAFNYFGGKYNFLEQLYEYFPDHFHFVDVFCGSMAVTLNKLPSKMDTANDINGDVINFFKVLREHPMDLLYNLELTPTSRQEYKNCFPINSPGISDVERARRFFVRCRQSFQGTGIEKSTGFNACIATSEKSLSKNVSKFLSSVYRLPAVIEKLRTIQIESLDYSVLLEKYDRSDTFFYCDPPYELRMRNYKKWYSNEFLDNDHFKMADILKNIKGKAMVSGYDSPMYHNLFSGWNFIKLKPLGHSMKINPQQECIWMNY
jgi:DNA adenine methylase